jgi:hypothetical protein
MARTAKKNSPKERIAISLIQRMTHPVSHQTAAPMYSTLNFECPAALKNVLSKPDIPTNKH